MGVILSIAGPVMLVMAEDGNNTVGDNDRNSVKPIDWSRFTNGLPEDESSLRMENILLNAVKYNLTVWYEENFGSQTGGYLDLGGVGEGNIRPPASAALGIATAIKLGIYDASFVGISKEEAVNRAIKIIKSAAYYHKVNSPGGWGDAWQSALWANLVGTSGWLMWDDLSTTDREYVRKMVEYEANRFITYEVPYYMDESGNIKYPGDTKAEENAWNSGILQLATSMMPSHVNWNGWMDKNIELMISSYARPHDLNNTEILHGKQVKEWLNGTNAYDDGTVINHSRIHPDYMTSIGQIINAPVLYTLAEMATPKAAFFNADIVYNSLVDLKFDSPPYNAPGGTIYIDDSPDIYYPQGNDWGTHRRMNFAMMDTYADAFGFDNLVTQKADYWENYHAQMVLDMQNRHDDGRTYSASSEDTYSGREQWVALLAARAYQAKWIKHQNKYILTNDSYFGSLPESWEQQTIGGASGYSDYSGDTFSIESTGHVGGINDSFKYAYKQVYGDATIIARLNSLESTSENATAGIMIRKSLDQDAQNVYVSYTASGDISISYRNEKGEETHTETPIEFGQDIPVWFKLEKVGNTINGYYSTDGAEWNLITTQVISMDNISNDSYIGIVTVPGSLSQASEAVFENVQINAPDNLGYVFSNQTNTAFPGETINVSVTLFNTTEHDITVQSSIDLREGFDTSQNSQEVTIPGNETVNLSYDIEVLPGIDSGKYVIPINISYGQGEVINLQSEVVVRLAPNATLFEEDFEDFNENTWTVESGEWATTLEDGSTVYEGSSNAAALSVAGDRDWSDYIISVDMKPIMRTAPANLSSGIIFRYNGTGNFYHFRLSNNAGRTVAELYKWENGVAKLLKEIDYNFTQGTWYELKIDVQGEQIDGYVNDELLISIIDEGTSLMKGGIGFRTYHEQTVFDNLLVMGWSDEVDDPAVLDDVSLSADQTELNPGESTVLSVSGLMNDGTEADLSGADIEYASSHPDIVEIDAEGRITLAEEVQDVRSFEVWSEVTLAGITVTSNIVEFDVAVSIPLIRDTLEYYKDMNALQTPLYKQLSNRLDQVEHHKDHGRDNAAVKHMQDFQKHLYKRGMQKYISEEARDILDADAQVIIDRWSEEKFYKNEENKLMFLLTKTFHFGRSFFPS